MTGRHPVIRPDSAHARRSPARFQRPRGPAGSVVPAGLPKRRPAD